MELSRPEADVWQASSTHLAEPLVDREEAFGVLFRTHAPGLLRLAWCLLGDRESAEDAVQEAYVSLYRNWGRLNDVAAAHAYLRSAVINRGAPRGGRRPPRLRPRPAPTPGGAQAEGATQEWVRIN